MMDSNQVKKLFAAVIISFLITSAVSCKKREVDTASAPPASVGNVAPDFKLNDVNGKAVELSEFKGRVVLVEFWATWCGPCGEFTPILNELYKKYKEKGFVILALTSEGNEDTITSYIKDNNVTYTVLLADMKTIRRYGVISIPTSFLIDKEGKIVEKHMGFADDSLQKLSQEIEKLL